VGIFSNNVHGKSCSHCQESFTNMQLSIDYLSILTWIWVVFSPQYYSKCSLVNWRRLFTKCLEVTELISLKLCAAFLHKFVRTWCVLEWLKSFRSVNSHLFQSEIWAAGVVFNYSDLVLRMKAVDPGVWQLGLKLCFLLFESILTKLQWFYSTIQSSRGINRD